ncbi:MAG: hypothetical protein JW999_12000 [Methanotrichaceae archaeon]|nr:hypothetical protein [Methanotrichaceae archaeon]
MNKQFIILTAILILAIAVSIAVTAQESNATTNNATLNNTILDNAMVGALNQTEQNSTLANDSAVVAFDIGAANHAAQNLSTANGQPIVVAPISEMAGVAPLVAAGASSAQVASEPEGSFKIGNGVGGSDPFNPEHVQIESLKLGIPTKPMRDAGKMFFVCDIV